MAATVDDLMSASQMRPILAVSKREPVAVALGLTADKVAAVLLSKKLAPKKVRSQLRSEAKKLKLEVEAGSIRFGMAVVDEEDGGLLLFRVNKAPPGALVTKVRERMRKANWSKIEFVVDESLEEEAEEGEAEGEAALGNGAPGGLDVEALRRELAALIGRIAGAVSAGLSMEALRELAAKANEAIKAGTDLAHAAAQIGKLREALDAGGAGGARAGSAVDPDELLATFRDAKDDVDAGLNKLGAALRATGDVDMLQIADYGLFGMTEGGGVGLLKALFDLRGAGPERREAALQAARQAAAKYRAAVLSDGIVDLVDANPFGVEVGIKSKLVAALDKIASA